MKAKLSLAAVLLLVSGLGSDRGAESKPVWKWVNWRLLIL